MKDAVIKDAMNSIENRICHVYNQGYEDGLKDGKESVQIDETEAYECGLNDAWECARKIYNDLSMDKCIEIFEGKSWFFDYNASEAIAKIKEYEEKQKRTCDTCQYLHGGFNSLKKCANCYGNSGWTPKLVEDAEIKVGDEVIYCGGGAHDGSVGVVLGTEKDWVEVKFKFKSCWNCVGVWKDSLTKTGRHFSQIEEVLEQMKGEEE